MRKLVCWLAILALVMSACGAMADNVLLLKEGSSSSKTVAVLQNDLISLGYLSGEPDGHYGEGTAEAVRAFREAHHLSPEGGVDTDMVVAIYEDQGRPTLTEGMRTMPVFAVQRVLVIAGFVVMIQFLVDWHRTAKAYEALGERVKNGEKTEE